MFKRNHGLPFSAALHKRLTYKSGFFFKNIYKNCDATKIARYMTQAISCSHIKNIVFHSLQQWSTSVGSHLVFCVTPVILLLTWSNQ